MNSKNVNNFSKLFQSDLANQSETNKSSKKSASSAFLEMFKDQMKSSFQKSISISSKLATKNDFVSKRSPLNIKKASLSSHKSSEKVNSFKALKVSRKPKDKIASNENKKIGKQNTDKISKEKLDDTSNAEKLKKLRKTSKNADFWNQLDDTTALELIQNIQALGESGQPSKLASLIEQVQASENGNVDLTKDLKTILGNKDESQSNLAQQIQLLLQNNGEDTKKLNSKENSSKEDKVVKSLEENKTELSGIVAEDSNAAKQDSDRSQDINKSGTKETKKTKGKHKSVESQKDLNNEQEVQVDKAQNQKISLRERISDHTKQVSEESQNAEMANETSANIEDKSKINDTGGQNRVSNFSFEQLTSSNSSEIKKKILTTLIKQNNGNKSKIGAVGKSFTYNSKLTSSNRSAFNHSSQNNGESYSGNSSGLSAKGNSTQNTANKTTTTNNLLFAEILEKAEMIKNSSGQKVMNVELSPEGIGKLAMRLTSRDGKVAAKISAEDVKAKEKLDKAIPDIKNQLKEQGINLSEITVDIFFRNPDERSKSQENNLSNKSNQVTGIDNGKSNEIIRKNILPHLRRTALNIQAIDLVV